MGLAWSIGKADPEQYAQQSAEKARRVYHNDLHAMHHLLEIKWIKKHRVGFDTKCSFDEENAHADEHSGKNKHQKPRRKNGGDQQPRTKRNGHQSQCDGFAAHVDTSLLPLK